MSKNGIFDILASAELSIEDVRHVITSDELTVSLKSAFIQQLKKRELSFEVVDILSKTFFEESDAKIRQIVLYLLKSYEGVDYCIEVLQNLVKVDTDDVSCIETAKDALKLAEQTDILQELINKTWSVVLELCELQYEVQRNSEFAVYVCSCLRVITEVHIRDLSALSEFSSTKQFSSCELFLQFISSFRVDTELPDSLVTSMTVWTTIIRGLSSDLGFTRKQGLYMLKRLFDTCGKRKLSIPEKYFIDDDTICVLITLLETLEETQIHVIEPVLPLYKEIFKGFRCDKIAFSWIGAIVLRTAIHDSVQIKKWGIETFFIETALCKPRGVILQFLKENTLRIINIPELYHRHEVVFYNEKFPVASAFYECLRIVDQETSYDFWEDILDEVVEASWSTTPLLFFSESLSLLTNRNWNLRCLKTVSRLCYLNRQNDVVHRSAIQCFCFKACLHKVIEGHVTCGQFVSILNQFDIQECLLSPDNELWKLCRRWVAQDSCWSKSDIKEFLSSHWIESLQKNSNFERIGERIETFICFMLLVLENDTDDAEYGGGLISTEDLISFINSATHNLFRAVSCPYVPMEESSLSFAMMGQLLVKTTAVNGAGKVKSHIEGLVSKNADNLIQFFHQSLDRSDVFLDLLRCLSESCDALSDILLQSVKTLKSPSTLADWKVSSLKDFEDVTLEHIIQSLSVKRRSCLMKGDSTENLLKILQWRSLGAVIERVCDDDVDVEGILQLCSDSVDITVDEDELVALFDAASVILNHFKVAERYPKSFASMVASGWRSLGEQRGSASSYWPIYESFLRCLILPSLRPSQCSEQLSECLEEMTELIFTRGDERLGMVYCLTKRLFATIDREIVLTEPIYRGILVQALLFGPQHRKSNKYDERVRSYLRKEYKSTWRFNQIFKLRESDERVPALQFLYDLTQADTRLSAEGLQGIAAVISAILERELVWACVKGPHKNYLNSQAHRQRHRAACAFHLLADCEGVDENVLISWLQEVLNRESIPSLRHYAEWLSSRLLAREISRGAWSRADAFFEQLKKPSLTKPANACSLLTTSALLMRQLSQESVNMFADRLVKVVIPWCGAQNFNCRLHALGTLSWMTKLCDKSLPLQDIVESFLNYAKDMGSGNKTLNKFLQHFWWQDFNPLQHRSPVTLYFVLPYLFGITDEEWIEPDRLCGPPVDEALLKCSPGTWRIKACGDSVDAVGQLGVDSGVADVQKKIQPWLQSRPNPEILRDTENSMSRRFVKDDSGLILVATLIDKPTNLGGLARTCEIFGVQEMVINNLRMLEDPSFISLSVTAQKWLNVTEVAEQFLTEFLLEKALAGYTLVGIEQTANSVPLQEFKFPEKTLLLLGHERWGIPVNLINRLSVCVEIPQFGVIRSLNVHVTGALVIWEYNRQRLTA